MEGKLGNPENPQNAFPTRFLYRIIQSLIEDNNLFSSYQIYGFKWEKPYRRIIFRVKGI